MQRFLSLLLTLSALPILGLADSWAYEAGLTEDKFQFADITVVRIIDARDNESQPDFAIRIIAGENLLALHPGVSFTHLQVSADGEYIVGLSNRGLPGTAVVIFDRRGNLMAELKHSRGQIDYCDRSVTLVRTWYDEEDPHIQFHYSERYSDDLPARITIRGCDGNEVDLGKLF